MNIYKFIYNLKRNLYFILVKEMKYILSLDPASSTGYARCSIDDRGEVSVSEYGILEVKNCSNEEFSSVGETCNILYEKVEALLNPLPEIVYIEDFFVSSRCTRGVNLNFFLRGAISMLLSKRNIRYKFISPSEWKSYVTGVRGGRPTQAMKRAQGSSANKTIITDKLKERYGITFPEKIMIDGKLRKFKYDISDAIGIAFCGIHSNFPSAKFPCPKDEAKDEAEDEAKD